MTERATINRPISSLEVDVIKAVLAVALPGHDIRVLTSGIENWHVIGRCACGCDTVQFAKPTDSMRVRPVAEGIGKTPSGGRVGIIVFAAAEAITELEVYDLGAGQHDLRLPIPASVRAWSADPTS